MAELIRKHGGEPFVAPSMREAPLEGNEQAFAAVERLFAGEFDMFVFLTGVGARALHRLIATRHPGERFPEALRRITVVARGPKPVAALREMDVPAHIQAPEPNTWREVVEAVKPVTGRRIAVQEYGRSNPELIQALGALGAAVTPIRIYQWQLPEDTGPLRQAARELGEGRFQAALFTTPFQLVHLFRIAEEEGISEQARTALRRAFVGSIGPATTEMLASYDLAADMEPSHPKMGLLVREAAERAPRVLEQKRAG
ncbi:MAG: uroporphyrinogen-III synthase [Bryobacteraceae bacterium]|nr:uroporphyrinogen-III synthase [Bryobacteraceae bacterium]